MFVRFVVPSLGRRAWGLTGIIQAALDLQEADALIDHEGDWLDSILDWFDEYLPIPYRFCRTRRASNRYEAICWFKPTAGECICKAHELAALLELLGLYTIKLRTRKPGYVVYEDAYQVAAVPYRDTVQD